jgi:transcriptional regulator with XRE-family HTH domain
MQFEEPMSCSLDFDGSGFQTGAGSRKAFADLTVEVRYDGRVEPFSTDLCHVFSAPDPLKVFLAHPMTGLSPTAAREFASVDEAIVRAVESCVDPPPVFYDPEVEYDPDEVNQEHVYSDDEQRLLLWAELLIVNQPIPADGIGMLENQAGLHGIPTLHIFPKDRLLSPMHEGLSVRLTRQIQYTSIEELDSLLRQIVPMMLPEVRIRARQRAKVLELGASESIGRALCRCRLCQGMSLEDLSVRTGIAAPALHRIECDPNALLRFPIETIWAISRAIGAETTISASHLAIRVRTEPSASFANDSLSELVQFRFDRLGAGYSSRADSVIVKCWIEYTEMLTSLATRDPKAFAGAPSLHQIVDRAEWEKRFSYYLARLI